MYVLSSWRFHTCVIALSCKKLQCEASYSGCQQDPHCIEKSGVAVRYDPWSNHADFWRQRYATWEDFTFWIFRQYVNADSVVLDIGGWIGPTALWFAGVASKVIVVEPSRLAFETLARNVAANPDKLRRISMVQAAVGKKPGFISMTNTGDSMDRLQGIGLFAGKCAFGRLSHVGCDNSRNDTLRWVNTVTPRDLVLQHPELHEASFVKIDVEGAELLVVPALQDFLLKVKPVLFVSLHPLYLIFSQLKGIVDKLSTICPELLVKNPIVDSPERLIPFSNISKQLLGSANIFLMSFDLVCTFGAPQCSSRRSCPPPPRTVG